MTRPMRNRFTPSSASLPITCRRRPMRSPDGVVVSSWTSQRRSRRRWTARLCSQSVAPSPGGAAAPRALDTASAVRSARRASTRRWLYSLQLLPISLPAESASGAILPVRLTSRDRKTEMAKLVPQTFARDAEAGGCGGSVVAVVTQSFSDCGRLDVPHDVPQRRPPVAGLSSLLANVEGEVRRHNSCPGVDGEHHPMYFVFQLS